MTVVGCGVARSQSLAPGPELARRWAQEVTRGGAWWLASRSLSLSKVERKRWRSL
jgi:hypothetical protein